jgi:hypothetical protein
VTDEILCGLLICAVVQAIVELEQRLLGPTNRFIHAVLRFHSAARSHTSSEHTANPSPSPTVTRRKKFSVKVALSSWIAIGECLPEAFKLIWRHSTVCNPEVSPELIPFRTQFDTHILRNVPIQVVKTVYMEGGWPHPFACRDEGQVSIRNKHLRGYSSACEMLLKYPGVCFCVFSLV